MKLSPYLTEQGIKLDLEGQKKEPLIRSLAELLRDSPNMLNFELFLEDVFKREEECSTGIGEGVAIPHARTEAVNDFVVAVGRVPSGVDFEAIDEKKVDTIILMGTPVAAKRTYLRFLATLSLMLKSPGFREGLALAKDAGEVIKVFQRHEPESDE